MAQLSSNSQRTAGIEGGGTQSATLQIIREAGAYATMLARALRELNHQHEKRRLKWQLGEGNKEEPFQVSSVHIQQENDQPLLNQQVQGQIEGTEQKRLTPGADGLDGRSLEPLSPKEVAISRKERLTIEIQVGNYRLEDSYLNLPKRFDKMPTSHEQALTTAMSGGIPEQDVYIRVRDEFDNQSEFFAGTQQNKGWKVSDDPSEDLSAHDIEQDLQRQKMLGVQKIRGTMEKLKPEGGPDMFRGRSLVVLTDGDEVIVIDKNTGIIRDAERLEQIGELGEQAVRQSALEAAGSFGIKGSAAKGIAAPRTQKQRELTP